MLVFGRSLLTLPVSSYSPHGIAVTLPVVLAAPQISFGNNQFSFLLSGPSGSNYVLQVSTNLLNWSPVSTSSIPISGSITLSNGISGYGNRFYRITGP